MQVIWSPASLRQIEHIHDYIARDNPVAAARMADTLHEAGRGLVTFPHRGRPIVGTMMRRWCRARCATSHRGRPIVGTMMRELIVRPYIIRYTVDGDRVLILRVRHGARRPTNP